MRQRVIIIGETITFNHNIIATGNSTQLKSIKWKTWQQKRKKGNKIESTLELVITIKQTNETNERIQPTSPRRDTQKNYIQEIQQKK